jgi:peptidoglycan pentaglycine glycine transferase (the first glycine)
VITTAASIAPYKRKKAKPQGFAQDVPLLELVAEMTNQHSASADPIPTPQPCEGAMPEAEPGRPCRLDPWQEWDAFLEGRPDTGFMQSSWWVDFRRTCGFEHFGATLRAEDGLVGGAVVSKFYYTEDICFYYIQDGPVLPSDESEAEAVFRAVLEVIEEQRKQENCVVSHLRMEPRWLSVPAFVQGFRSVPPLADHYLEARDTRCIDLRASESAILAQMKPKGRYNIGVARRHGVSIVEDTSERGLADFQSIYEETAERQGMEAKPPDYFETLLSLVSPSQHGSLFFAEYGGVRLATALAVYFGPRATYFYGGSRALHRQVMAPYLMHFEIMRKAKALGHEWYDLWGIAPSNEANHPWQNFTAFKAKFGGDELHLVPTLDFVYDTTAYERYMAMENSSDNH